MFSEAWARESPTAATARLSCYAHNYESLFDGYVGAVVAPGFDSGQTSCSLAGMLPSSQPHNSPLPQVTLPRRRPVPPRMCKVCPIPRAHNSPEGTRLLAWYPPTRCTIGGLSQPQMPAVQRFLLLPVVCEWCMLVRHWLLRCSSRLHPGTTVGHPGMPLNVGNLGQKCC